MALDIGFVVMAARNRNSPRVWLILRAVERALIVSTSEMFLPLCGKKPWFARVFSMGQGARTIDRESNLSILIIFIQVCLFNDTYHHRAQEATK